MQIKTDKPKQAKPFRRKYVPDLKALMRICEGNYLRFLRLLPEMDEEGAQWVFAVEMPDDRLSEVAVTVTERSRYTTTIMLKQASYAGCWVPEPTIIVRLYHDARLAEVLSYQNNQRIKPSYDYPNSHMYHRNEKAQLNQFLGEWLDSCLTSGCALEIPLFQ